MEEGAVETGIIVGEGSIGGLSLGAVLCPARKKAGEENQNSPEFGGLKEVEEGEGGLDMM